MLDSGTSNIGPADLSDIIRRRMMSYYFLRLINHLYGIEDDSTRPDSDDNQEWEVDTAGRDQRTRVAR